MLFVKTRFDPLTLVYHASWSCFRDKEKSEEEKKKREMEAMLEQQRLEEEARSKKGGKKKDSAKLVQLIAYFIIS